MVPIAAPGLVKCSSAVPAVAVGISCRASFPTPQPPLFRRQLRQTEIQDLRLTALGHENVRRLDVPMDDALGVGRVQRIGNLNRQLQHFLRPEWLPGKALLQGLPLQILHGDEGLAFVLANLVNRADIGMVECRGGPCFPLETLQRLMVLRQLFGKEV
jgi:hypothetical protein